MNRFPRYLDIFKRHWHRPLPLTLLSLFFFYLALPALPHATVRGVRLFFDYWDPVVYYKTTIWVVADHVLYRDVPSEYPLLANLVFAAVRWLSGFAAPLVEARAPEVVAVFGDLLPFLWIWISAGFVLYFFLAKYSLRLNPKNLWLWLVPAPLYFALYRYDIYPALAAFVCLWLLKEQRYLPAMAALGICIALKGYAVIYLPALFVFFMSRQGFGRAALLCSLALLPFAAGNLLVWALLDFQAMAMPYAHQFGRGLNGAGTFNSLIRMIALVSESRAGSLSEYFSSASPTLALHALAAAVSMAVLPRTIPQLARCFYFSTMAFISASTFYSPQFVLWVLPCACFFVSRPVFYGTLVFAWLTFLYFPILSDLGSPHNAIVLDLLSGIRLGLILLVFVGFRRDEADGDAAATGVGKAAMA